MSNLSVCASLNTCCLTCVVTGYIYPHGRALPLARPSLLRRPGAVEVGQGEAAALGRQLGEVELGVVLRSLHQRLEVEPAVNQAVLHAEVVAGGQRLVASGAREAAQVVHGVARSHHHLRGRNPEVAARAPLHGEPSGTDRPSRLLTHREKPGGTQHNNSRAIGAGRVCVLPKNILKDGDYKATFSTEAGSGLEVG